MIPDPSLVLIQAMSLLESLLPHYQHLQTILTADNVLQLWNSIKQLLKPDCDSLLLSHIFHLVSVLLEFMQKDCVFVVNDVFSLLGDSLQNVNEHCRAEACRTLGWICQVFPDVLTM